MNARNLRTGAWARTWITLLVASGGHTVRAAQEAVQEQPRPNVLFIAVDDLNDWVGCLGGNPQARTPNIDRLAARGVLFTCAHAAAPICNPSRTSVLTGMAPHRTGIYGQDPPFREVVPDAVTLPQALRAHGYTTLGSGNVFHRPFPDPDSWDHYFPSKELQVPPDSGKRRLEKIFGSFSSCAAESAAQLGDAKVASWVRDVLRRQPPGPFFLGCGFFRPHVPWIAPASAFERFPLEAIQLSGFPADDLDDLPEAALDQRESSPPDEEGARRAVQAYLACVAFVDDRIGELLDVLDARPDADRTIVVLWSDNGFHMGEKQHWAKHTLWEESTRVPLIIVAPGVQAGARCDRPVSLLDLYPTLLELCGLPASEGLDGQSLVPLLHDPRAAWERPALTTLSPGNHAVRSERWRFIRYADGSEELYDHGEDPHEWHNRAAEPGLAEVKADLARWIPTEDAPERRR